jgi:hypothetical protein
VTGEVALRPRAVGPLDRVDAELDERPAMEHLPIDDALTQVLDPKLTVTLIGPGGCLRGRRVGGWSVVRQAAALAGAWVIVSPDSGSNR